MDSKACWCRQDRFSQVLLLYKYNHNRRCYVPPSIGQVYDIYRKTVFTSIPSFFALTTIFNSKGYTLYKGTLLSGLFATLLGALGLFSYIYLSETTLHRDECSIWWAVTISLSYEKHCFFVCMYWRWSIYILTGCDNVLCARTVAVCIARHFLYLQDVYDVPLEDYIMHAYHGFWHKGDIFAAGL